MHYHAIFTTHLKYPLPVSLLTPPPHLSGFVPVVFTFFLSLIYRHHPCTYTFTFYVFYMWWRLETFRQKYRKTENISVHNESNPKTVITSIPITPMFLEDTLESSAEVSFRMEYDSSFLLMISSFFLLSMDSWRVIFTSSQTQTQVTLLVICVDPLVL